MSGDLTLHRVGANITVPAEVLDDAPVFDLERLLREAEEDRRALAALPPAARARILAERAAAADLAAAAREAAREALRCPTCGRVPDDDENDGGEASLDPPAGPDSTAPGDPAPGDPAPAEWWRAIPGIRADGGLPPDAYTVRGSALELIAASVQRIKDGG